MKTIDYVKGVIYMGGSDLGDDVPEFWVSALFIYKFSSFILEPVNVSKWGFIISSPTLLCKATIQNTEAFLTHDSLLS